MRDVIDVNDVIDKNKCLVIWFRLIKIDVWIDTVKCSPYQLILRLPI